MTTPLTPEIRDLLALHLVPGLGPRLTAALIEHFGSARAVLEAPSDLLCQVPHVGPKISTGLVDPQVEVRPTRGQVDDLVGEIKQRVDRGERALVTTLTKRMSEDLSEYLQELGMKVHW